MPFTFLVKFASFWSVRVLSTSPTFFCHVFRTWERDCALICRCWWHICGPHLWPSLASIFVLSLCVSISGPSSLSPVCFAAMRILVFAVSHLLAFWWHFVLNLLSSLFNLPFDLVYLWILFVCLHVVWCLECKTCVKYLILCSLCVSSWMCF